MSHNTLEKNTYAIMYLTHLFYTKYTLKPLTHLIGLYLENVLLHNAHFLILYLKYLNDTHYW